jgi:ABC-type transporter MlaC component
MANRAASDDTSSESDQLQAANDEELAKLKERKRKQKKEREKYAKVMGLEYFLEMVDHKRMKRLRSVEWSSWSNLWV